MSSNFELNLSLLVVAFLVAVYIVYESVSIPAGGHPFGHALGILGASLMLLTEMLYSARKRWGEFPRVVRLDSLTNEQKRLVLALVDAAKSTTPEAA